jgi:hypothetical protein
MKKIYVLIFMMAGLFASCIEDNGNYVYTALNEVTITGLENSYRFILQEPRTLTPQVATTIDPANLTYCWRIGSDTLATTKQFNYTFSEKVTTGDQLVFEVYDKTTNVRYAKRMPVVIVSPFETGWLIFGNGAGGTPTLSFQSYEEGNTFYADVYSEVNKSSLTGKAKMVKQYSYQDGITGSYFDRVSVICEGGNSVELDGTSLLRKKFYQDEFKDNTITIDAMNSEFYGPDYAIYIIGNGKVYVKAPGIMGTPDEAYYQYPLAGDSKGYKLDPVYTKGASYSDFYLSVDELNHRYVGFKRSSLSTKVASIATNATASIKTIDPENLEGKCIWMGQSNAYDALCIFKTDAGKYVLHTLSCYWDGTWTLLSRYEFPDGVINDQTCFAPHKVNPYLMIGTGNQLMALNLQALSAGADAVNQIATYEGAITAMHYAYDINKNVNEFGIAIQSTTATSSLLLVNPSLTAKGEILKRYDNISGKLVSVWRKIM